MAWGGRDEQNDYLSYVVEKSFKKKLGNHLKEAYDAHKKQGDVLLCRFIENLAAKFEIDIVNYIIEKPLYISKEQQ